METANEESRLPFIREYHERTWLGWLVRARFIVVTCLLGIELAVIRFTAALVPLRVFLTVVFAWYTVAVFFMLLHVIWTETRRQARVQVATDLLFATAIVYITGGGVDTPFSFVYPLLIIVASMVLPRLWAYATALSAFILYGAVLELSYFDVIKSYAVTRPDPKWLLALIFINLFAYLAIAYLASTLSAKLRQVDYELQDTSGALEDLQAIHENIIDSMHGGLITTDLDGNVLLLNAPGEQILGRFSPKVRGIPVQDLFLDPLPSGASAPLNREVRSMRPDGAEIIVGITATRLTLTGGQTIGYVYTFADLTNIKRLEREVRMKDRLSAVGRMAGGIAHEIRNPLSSIAGSVKLLSRMSTLTEEQQSLIDIVTRESERLNSIISEFLNYTREKNYKFVETDLVELLRETTTLIQNREQISTGAIKVVRNFLAEQAPAVVDTDRMKQVFWNLSENAFRAMSTGGTLTIEIAPEPPDWRITFRDTGVGLNADKIEKIFEPFQSHFEGGTGFGLAVVYQIVQAHGAHIGVRSEPGSGAEFSIYISARESARADTPIREELSAASMAQRRAANG